MLWESESQGSVKSQKSETWKTHAIHFLTQKYSAEISECLPRVTENSAFIQVPVSITSNKLRKHNPTSGKQYLIAKRENLMCHYGNFFWFCES